MSQVEAELYDYNSPSVCTMEGSPPEVLLSSITMLLSPFAQLPTPPPHPPGNNKSVCICKFLFVSVSLLLFCFGFHRSEITR